MGRPYGISGPSIPVGTAALGGPRRVQEALSYMVKLPP